MSRAESMKKGSSQVIKKPLPDMKKIVSKKPAETNFTQPHAHTGEPSIIPTGPIRIHPDP